MKTPYFLFLVFASAIFLNAYIIKKENSKESKPSPEEKSFLGQKPPFLLFIILLIIGCNTKNDRANHVIKYYQAFNNSDYHQIKGLITDSITITEGDYIMPFSEETFYEHFKWDSIFRPSYKVIDINHLNNQIIATVEVYSLRFEFLKNNPLTCRHKISFESGKLTKFENLECIDADWAIWEKERHTLVNWIKVHHSELNGFIDDLTMSGAINYLKAIELYKNRKDSL